MDNIKRIKRRNDYMYIKETYKNIYLNYRISNRKNYINKKKCYLFANEGYITLPENYNLNIIKKFKGLITPNTRFYNKFKNKTNIILSNGPVDWNNFYSLNENEFVNYNNKLKGICSLNKIYETGQMGDVLYLRKQVFNKLKNIIKHSYGRIPYGGKHFQKKASDPSTKDSLQIINKYLFCLALEPMYHEMWSWDWVTERMWNCFRAKTIPVYFGCYNIEKLVPQEFYIDLRKYILTENPKITFDCKRLVKDLNSFSEKEYIKIVEKAYNWQKNNKIGNVDELEKIFKRLQ